MKNSRQRQKNSQRNFSDDTDAGECKNTPVMRSASRCILWRQGLNLEGWLKMNVFPNTNQADEG